MKLAPGYFFPLSTSLCSVSIFYSVTTVGIERLDNIFIGTSISSMSISMEPPITVLNEFVTLF